jgi:hypothetical protein
MGDLNGLEKTIFMQEKQKIMLYYKLNALQSKHPLKKSMIDKYYLWCNYDCRSPLFFGFKLFIDHPVTHPLSNDKTTFTGPWVASLIFIWEPVIKMDYAGIRFDSSIMDKHIFQRFYSDKQIKAQDQYLNH